MATWERLENIAADVTFQLLEMKRFAYLLIILGLSFFALAVNDDHLGIASVTPPASNNGVRYTAKKADNPEQFHNLMTYEWIRAFLMLGAGITHSSNVSPR